MVATRYGDRIDAQSIARSPGLGPQHDRCRPGVKAVNPLALKVEIVQKFVPMLFSNVPVMFIWSRTCR